MTKYIVKIGFWLRAYDGFTVEAESDADAIEQAKASPGSTSGRKRPTRTGGRSGSN
jgi:hypothetical protein